MGAAEGWRRVSESSWRHPAGYQLMTYLDGIVPRWSAFHPRGGWFCVGVLSRQEAAEACRRHAEGNGFVGGN